MTPAHIDKLLGILETAVHGGLTLGAFAVAAIALYFLLKD